jgi:hypothetical protein
MGLKKLCHFICLSNGVSTHVAVWSLRQGMIALDCLVDGELPIPEQYRSGLLFLLALSVAH